MTIHSALKFAAGPLGGDTCLVCGVSLLLTSSVLRAGPRTIAMR